MRAVLLDTAADAAAAASVAVTGAVILATGGNFWLDRTVALAVSAVIAYHAIMLVVRVTEALRAETATESVSIVVKQIALDPCSGAYLRTGITP